MLPCVPEAAAALSGGGRGVVPPTLLPPLPLAARTRAEFCNTIRAPRTSHCYDCNACVLELDHHCPWMGKCVGKYNLCYFYAFLWAIATLFLFTAAAFFTWLVNKPRDGQ